MKFCNSFAELDHCTAAVCGLFQFALWPVIALARHALDLNSEITGALA
jgi:hypothetical protein